jgi:hypothetical protein
MKYENTFVRCNDAAHFKAVAEVYQRAGYPTSGGVRGEIKKYTGEYPILGDCGKEVWMHINLLEFGSKKDSKELFLVNDELVPKNTPQTKPQTSRRTEITYNEVTGKVISFKNVLTKEEAEKLAPGYTSGIPHYYVVGSYLFLKNNTVLMSGSENILNCITCHRINLLKEAGDRFTKLRKEHEQKSVKTIVI